MTRMPVSLAFAAVGMWIVASGCSPEERDFSTGGATSAGSGTGGGAGAGGGAASSGAGGQVPGTENCLNGQDDDSDGLVDCQDTDCSAYTCMPAVPNGWTGPLALSLGGTAPSTCAPGYDTQIYEGYTDLQYGPAACEACACATPNVTCVPNGFGSWDTTGCPALGWGTSQNVGACTPLAVPNQDSYRASPPTAMVGSCTPSGGAPMGAPAPAWNTVGLACGLASGMNGAGCGQDACAPKLEGTGFLSCILQDGDVACPASFADRHVLYDDPSSFADMRGCSPCECGAGTGSCTITTTVYTSLSCNNVLASVPNNGTCMNAPGGYAIRPAVASSSGSCPPMGGAPTGTVDPTGAATTICCRP